MTRLLTSIADSCGLVLVTTMMAGCLHVPGPCHELRPFVAVCGAYSLVAAPPSPSPVPAVCKTCGGKGVLGDGRVAVPCPDCQKKKETSQCQSQTCTAP